VIQSKQAAIGRDADYTGAIDRLIDTEIRPAARAFKNKLQAIDESLFGAIAKGVVAAAGGPSVLTIFGDLSWHRILAIGVAASAYVSTALIENILAERAAKRDCSISYILSLDDRI
jgi:hypothetical protein